MQTAYKLVFRDRQGNKQDETVAYQRLEYRRVVNNWGLLTYRIHADYHLNEVLAKFWQVEVHRRNPAFGVDWYPDFRGFFWFGNYEDPEDTGQDDFIAFCPAQNMRLAHEIVAYPANTANRTSFTNTPVETIAKTIVTRNLTNAGTVADGRIVAVPDWGVVITVEADGASGPSIDFNCAHQNVLNALQRLADIAGADFDLVTTGSQIWQFRWYPNGMGNDLRGAVSFSRKLGNMRRPRLIGGRLDETTRLVVGGQGSDADRDFAAVEGPDYHSSWNAITGFYSASSLSTADGLTRAGQARLEQLRALKPLEFEAVQTLGFQYGINYDLGDLVSARYRGVVQDMKVDTVHIAVDPRGNEEEDTIRIGLEVLS